MKRVSLLLAFLLLSSASSVLAQSAGPEPTCTDWQACRDRAEQARAAGEYERFHDLAWRAVQTRGGRDPELYFLLARAQSLSGRPHDAMVTLQRLAQEMHAPKDISADEDFRRVRALPGWPALQGIISTEASSAPAAPTEPDVPPAVRKPDVGTPGGAAGGARGPRPEARTGRPERENRRAEPPVETPRRNPLSDPTVRASEEVAHFAAGSFQAGGLAYDAVSRRFVVGNLPSRKLTVVEEGTNRSATLSGDAAQLLEVRALEIDRTQGDLWVISEGARNGSSEPISELHKLQLISGRVLAVYGVDPTNGPARFVDVAVGRSMGVLVLDAARPRLLRPAKDRKTLAQVMALPDGNVTSLAPGVDGRTVYVAYADHIARVDLGTGQVERLADKGQKLAGFTRVRWHKGSLLGVQTQNGTQQIVRVRLSANGRRVTSARILDIAEASDAPVTALDVLEDDFFYLVPARSQASIRRIRLK